MKRLFGTHKPNPKFKIRELLFFPGTGRILINLETEKTLILEFNFEEQKILINDLANTDIIRDAETMELQIRHK